jgi:hypothetical protein
MMGGLDSVGTSLLTVVVISDPEEASESEGADAGVGDWAR